MTWKDDNNTVEWMRMQHPDSPGQYPAVTVEAFDVVWGPKGWKKADDDAQDDIKTQEEHAAKVREKSEHKTQVQEHKTS